MIKGKTKSGFAFEISDEALDNYELLDALSEIEDDPLKVASVLTLLLGKDQKKRLLDHLRTDKGNVPIDAVTGELLEILNTKADTKNS